jgi:hypothetical protein
MPDFDEAGVRGPRLGRLTCTLLLTQPVMLALHLLPKYYGNRFSAPIEPYPRSTPRAAC